jgi:hypothetical protein
MTNFDRRNRRQKKHRDAKKKGKPGAGDGDGEWRDTRRPGGYKEIVKENAQLEAYYKVRGLKDSFKTCS